MAMMVTCGLTPMVPGKTLASAIYRPGVSQVCPSGPTTILAASTHPTCAHEVSHKILVSSTLGRAATIVGIIDGLALERNERRVEFPGPGSKVEFGKFSGSFDEFFLIE